MPAWIDEPSSVKLTAEGKKRLAELRGGCVCAPTNNPCWRCEAPLTRREEAALGVAPWQQPKQVDYIQAARSV